MTGASTTRAFASGPGAALRPVDLTVPAPTGRELRVAVQAVSVNPIDVKLSVREIDRLNVLGFDAAGVVMDVGPDVEWFHTGDEVFYAGSPARAGSFADLQLVDERLVGLKPTTLDFADAASMPLTSITAWESLFDCFGADVTSTGTLLVVGGAGGVGSMAIQLARAMTGLTVVATAARTESERWVRDRGAHAVADHRDLLRTVRAVAPDGVDFVLSPFSTGNIAAYAEMMSPRGRVVALDAPDLDEVALLKPKSITWSWESAFTRPLFDPADDSQHNVLTEIARLVDAGKLEATSTVRYPELSAQTLQEAIAAIESGRTIGKTVLANSAR